MEWFLVLVLQSGGQEVIMMDNYDDCRDNAISLVHLKKYVSASCRKVGK